jgi:guanylate kinase
MAATKTVLLILAGPAGVGKSTLCDRLVAEVPGFERVITATTRPPRPNEVNARDYHFLSEPEFDARLAAHDFLEWAWVHRKYRYGTLKSAVLDQLPHSSLVMNIDVQGVRSVRAAAQAIPLLKERLVTIFVAPDSLDVLRERLQGRGAVTLRGTGAADAQRRARAGRAQFLRLRHPQPHQGTGFPRAAGLLGTSSGQAGLIGARRLARRRSAGRTGWRRRTWPRWISGRRAGGASYQSPDENTLSLRGAKRRSNPDGSPRRASRTSR